MPPPRYAHYAFIYSVPKLSLSLSLPAVMAKHDPIITGLSSNYEEGQTLDINCTSDLSYPPAELIWYINDKEVSASEPRIWP